MMNVYKYKLIRQPILIYIDQIFKAGEDMKFDKKKGENKREYGKLFKEDDDTYTRHIDALICTHRGLCRG